MKKTAIILSLFIFLSACSSATEETANSNTAGVNINAANTEVVVVTNANSQMIPMNGVDANAFNGNSANVKVVNPDTSKLPPTLGPRPAPDESEFQTKGRNDGSFAETRTFKNHPQLSKIERVTNGREVSLKVYLKNGKAIEVTQEKIPNFRIAAAQDILLAVGIKPKVEAPPAQTTKGETKSEEKDEDGNQ